MTATTRWTVTGMTCGHCVSSVTKEVSAIDGVSAVTIDLVPGGESTVTVTSTEPLPEPVVRAAVDEAGFELIGAAT